MKYYPRHRGHKFDIAHTVFRKDQRRQIADMLAAGNSFDEVLEKVHHGENNSAISRQHFATKQDLNNIVRDFNISRSIPPCSYDADSGDAWTEEICLENVESSCRTVDENIAAAEQYWSEIHTAMSDNPEIAADVCLQLLRLKAMLPALTSRPHSDEVSQPCEPVKKAAPRRCVRSTKTVAKKRKAEGFVKPSGKRKIYLSNGLDDEIEAVSSTADHNYDARADDVVFEHSH